MKALAATNDFVIKFANVNGSGSASANSTDGRSTDGRSSVTDAASRVLVVNAITPQSAHRATRS